jgi:hypothetical protein
MKKKKYVNIHYNKLEDLLTDIIKLWEIAEDKKKRLVMKVDMVKEEK